MCSIRFGSWNCWRPLGMTILLSCFWVMHLRNLSQERSRSSSTHLSFSLLALSERSSVSSSVRLHTFALIQHVLQWHSILWHHDMYWHRAVILILLRSASPMSILSGNFKHSHLESLIGLLILIVWWVPAITIVLDGRRCDHLLRHQGSTRDDLVVFLSAATHVIWLDFCVRWVLKRFREFGGYGSLPSSPWQRSFMNGRHHS